MIRMGMFKNRIRICWLIEWFDTNFTSSEQYYSYTKDWTELTNHKSAKGDRMPLAKFGLFKDCVKFLDILLDIDYFVWVTPINRKAGLCQS